MGKPDDLETYADRERRLAYLKSYREKPENKERKRAYMRERYKDPYWKVRMQEQSAEYVEKKKAALQPLVDAELVKGCSRCPETDRRCLQFHHLDHTTKSFAIGAYVAHLRPGRDPSFVKAKKMMKDEIAKCEVLCANCHWKEHDGDWGRWSSSRPLDVFP